MADEKQSVALPLAEEVLRVDKREVVSGRVRVRTLTHRHEELVTQDLASERVEIERVPVGREVEAVPEIRVEGAVTVVPVVEETLVIEKRLVLKEELHIRRTSSVDRVETPVVLHRQEAVVERLDADGNPISPKEK